MWHVIKGPDEVERFIKCLAGQAYYSDGFACMHCAICAADEEGCDCYRCNRERATEPDKPSAP